jgi:RNA polymerase sigma-70 factor (ECF subfamily)
MPDSVPAFDASPQEAALGAEAYERYERALASLKNEDQCAVVSRVEFGMDYDEIAIELGKPTADAARMAVTRAIVRLASKMGHKRPRRSPRHGV